MLFLVSLAGAAVGAGLMYVLDPNSGARRRALARDQINSARRRLGDAAATSWADTRNRGQGLLAELRGRAASEPVTDEVLEQRIRSALGPLLRYPQLVEARAQEGVVTLTGAVPADEGQRLVRHIRRIRGVPRVDNQIQVYTDPADLPGVQPPIPPRPTGPRFELMQRNWAPSTRLAMKTLGASLFLGAVRRSPVAAVAGAVAVLALLRTAANQALADRPVGRRSRDRRASEGPEPLPEPSAEMSANR